MLSIWQRISNDFQTLWLAVNLSKKNPFFVFQELFSFLASLVLLLFLVSLGKKLLKFFHLRINLKEELLFALGLGIVFWGTLILLLGIFNLFNFWLIWGMAFFLFLICLPEVIAVVKGIGGLRETKKRVFFYFFLLLVILNVIGALTPEKGVDAIDYHLYFSKVYLQNQTMMLPARGSRLFSLFPHLVSLIYTLPISLDLTNVAQLTHLWLGVLTAIVVGILTQSFIASLIFYSLLTVGSISRSAYSDFFVCYFLSLGILGIVGENKGDKRRTILLSGLMFGGALATKNQSLALLPLLIILWLLFRQKEIINLFKLLVISFLVPLPWYLRSTVITGNPLYPLFELKDIRVPQLDLNYYFKFEFLKYLKVIFSFQPVFLLVFLFVIFSKSSLKNKKLRAYFLAGVLIFLFWVILPISFHDNRYFLPFFILTCK